MDLAAELDELRASEVRKSVRNRINEFKRIGNKGNNRWFSELAFCILTANSSAQVAIDIQEELGSSGFIELPLFKIKTLLKEFGHRFYRTRAEYIEEARRYSEEIKDIVVKFSTPFEAREWLVENVKGIGYKEGSHFLRNVGYEGLAILDRHVLRIIDRCDVISEIPNTLTKKRYLSIEEKVKELAEDLGISTAELDLYIWYLDTGKILK